MQRMICHYQQTRYILAVNLTLQKYQTMIRGYLDYYTPKNLFWGVYWNQPVGWSGRRAGGQSVCKILYIQLLLQFQPE